MRAYVAESAGTTWLTIVDVGEHVPVVTLTEDEARKLRNQLNSTLGHIVKRRKIDRVESSRL